MRGTPLEVSQRAEVDSILLTDRAAEEVPDKELALARLRRRFLDIFHHRPRQLFVTVNGITVASLDVASQKNELKAITKVAEPLQFVEVFSEQNVRLAMLNLDRASAHSLDRKTSISLSDHRRLRLSLKEHAAGLSIHLRYTDPNIEGWEILEANGLCCPVVFE